MTAFEIASIILASSVAITVIGGLFIIGYYIIKNSGDE